MRQFVRQLLTVRLLGGKSTVEAMVAAVARFSAHLAARPDGGDDPAALGKANVVAFLAGLRAQVSRGQLHPYMHARTVAFLRRFLRECRDLEPDGHGARLTGRRRAQRCSSLAHCVAEMRRRPPSGRWTAVNRTSSQAGVPGNRAPTAACCSRIRRAARPARSARGPAGPGPPLRPGDLGHSIADLAKPAAGGGRTKTFHHTALVRPVVAPDGTLRLNIHRLFPGSLWLGTFMVDVTGPRGSKASTVFIVIPPGG